MTDAFKDALLCGAEQLDITIDDTQLEKFFLFYQSVVEYNEKVNLTSILDEKEFAIKHIIDSISAASMIAQNASLVDIGAGAGFPSIPLKIMRPDLKITMLDGLNKRVVFLQKVVKELGLFDISAVHIRAEEAGRKPEYRASFDYAVARAVGATSLLLEYTVPLLKTGGTFINYKGSDISDSESAVAALNKLKTAFSGVKNFSLPYDLGARTLLSYKKLAATPQEYPRPSAKIAKFPL